MRAIQKFALLALPLALAACASGGSAIWQTLQTVWEGSDASTGGLNPNIRYLRVVVDGRVVRMALGYLDAHPAGPIEVWYSAEREALRLQNGRVVGAAGVATDWQSVSLPGFPPWSAMAKAEAPLQWLRTRDVMPGYRIGTRDILVTYAVPPPARSQLQGIDPKALTWFEERDDSPGRSRVAGAEGRLPVARYAVAIANGLETVVYGEQCLSPQWCFTWQRWPVAPTAEGKR